MTSYQRSSHCHGDGNGLTSIPWRPSWSSMETRMCCESLAIDSSRKRAESWIWENISWDSSGESVNDGYEPGVFQRCRYGRKGRKSGLWAYSHPFQRRKGHYCTRGIQSILQDQDQDGDARNYQPLDRCHPQLDLPTGCNDLGWTSTAVSK